MKVLYERRGIDARRLKKAAVGYSQWLDERKRVFNRHRTMTQTGLESELRSLLQSGSLPPISQNPKLLSFARQIVLERKIFDYRQLRLADGSQIAASRPDGAEGSESSSSTA